jgi:hypothetical protein
MHGLCHFPIVFWEKQNSRSSDEWREMGVNQAEEDRSPLEEMRPAARLHLAVPASGTPYELKVPSYRAFNRGTLVKFRRRAASSKSQASVERRAGSVLWHRRDELGCVNRRSFDGPCRPLFTFLSVEGILETR